VGDPYWPAYSPDGQYLYFSNVSGVPVGIARVKPDGTGLEVVTEGLHYRPTLSADGRFVAYHTDSQAFDLVVQVFDLGTRAVKAEFPGAFPEWAPAAAGPVIALVEGNRIVVVASDGSGRRYLTPATRVYAFQQMSWSPDGRWLLVRAEHGLEVIEVGTGLTLPLPFTALYSYAVWKPGS
jgi:Tol biopolymer transport system component